MKELYVAIYFILGPNAKGTFKTFHMSSYSIVDAFPTLLENTTNQLL